MPRPVSRRGKECPMRTFGLPRRKPKGRRAHARGRPNFHVEPGIHHGDTEARRKMPKVSVSPCLRGANLASLGLAAPSRPYGGGRRSRRRAPPGGARFSDGLGTVGRARARTIAQRTRRAGELLLVGEDLLANGAALG